MTRKTLVGLCAGLLLALPQTQKAQELSASLEYIQNPISHIEGISPDIRTLKVHHDDEIYAGNAGEIPDGIGTTDAILFTQTVKYSLNSQSLPEISLGFKLGIDPVGLFSFSTSSSTFKKKERNYTKEFF